MTYLFVAYLLNIIDYIFTAHWVRKFGIEIETNPICRWMFENNVAWVFKIFVVGLLFALLGYFIKKHRKGVVASYILFGVYSVIVVYHIIIAIAIC